MQEAARRFVGVARDHDRVALHALVNSRLRILSSLTNDRRQLLSTIEHMPAESSATPLYDVIILAYAEELAEKPNERNALIVVSDGDDNQLWQEGQGSEVPFARLRGAAAEMNALVYTVFLEPVRGIHGKPASGGTGAKEGKTGPTLRRFQPFPGRFSVSYDQRRNLQQLADATGGRLFHAQSIHDLEPVYAQVAEELRSVYTVAYAPTNQSFDGRWRTVKVKVNRPGARVRTRSGYRAR
jgi:VWFA-related protein